MSITALPWNNYKSENYNGYMVRNAEHYICICDSRSDTSNKANAAYIVKACNEREELLEVLEAFTQAIDPEEPLGRAEFYDKARELLTKAKQ